ncbi:MAG TPA: coenzyme F420-0:L-glutamate ligase, partial [Methanomicrobiales archaeon]|nr:coenzyme F420-0:L-glutamate ligase [Methanomicrobiales archaeon]
MTTSFSVYGLKTEIIAPGSDLVAILSEAAASSESQGLKEGDVIVVAETVVATAEGSLIRLSDVTPSSRAIDLAEQYSMDPRLVEIVLQESDSVVGGIKGFLLTMKGGTLLPNAGVDESNAPSGYVSPLPADPDASAEALRRGLEDRWGVHIAVVIADSRTHAMRLGCSGIAIGCAGIRSVVDERGRHDLFGRELHVTQRAVADCIASAAELVMGEADESVPAAIVRNIGLPIVDEKGIASID